jgi:hypothetical protein
MVHIGGSGGLHEGARRSDTSGVKVTRMEYRAGSRALYAIGAFLLLVPTTCLGWFVGGKLDEAVSAKNWPTVPGEVVSSRVAGNNRQSIPLVEYRYEVGGATFTGERVSVLGTLGRETAGQTVSRYPAGAAVSVHHDPDDPASAVLDTTVGPEATTAGLMIATPAAFGVVFLIAGALVARKGRSRVGGFSGKARQASDSAS